MRRMEKGGVVGERVILTPGDVKTKLRRAVHISVYKSTERDNQEWSTMKSHL
jgi:hypothetical protein